VSVSPPALPEVGAPTSKKHAVPGIFKILGPGIITGASDDDPAAIGTFAAVGASLGFATLWLPLLTLPLMATVQFICAKIGLVTGHGIAGVVHKYYSRKLLYPVVAALFIANTIGAGVDLGIMAAALNLIIPIPAPVLVPILTALILTALLFGSYKQITGVLKWLTLALFAYVAAALLSRPDWGEVLRATVLPSIHFDKALIGAVVAILGANISPYAFFWQTETEAEERRQHGEEQRPKGRARRWRPRLTNDEIKYAAMDVNVGMFFANLAMYCIILAAAATLHASGKTQISSAADLADALRPVAGDGARLLFAVGIVGSGLLAMPTLTGSAAYAVSQAFGWKYGLNRKPHQARQFYAVIVVAALIGMLINFAGFNPVDALVWASTLYGVLAPLLLVVIMLISNNREIMGRRKNGRLLNIMGWTATIIMFAASGALILTLLTP